MIKTISSYKSLMFVSVLVAAVVFSSTSYATAITKTVSGTAYDGDGNLWKNASVEVTCNSHVATATTDGTTGAYVTGYSASDCNNNDAVSVKVTKDSVTCSNTGTMGSQEVTVDVRCSTTPTVPEFGLLTGALATLGGAGSYLLMKRRSN